MTILAKPPLVRFDPTNNEHKIAFWMLLEKGKQHPTLRFILEDTYRSVPEMMEAKMTEKPITQWDFVKVSSKVTICQ